MQAPASRLSEGRQEDQQQPEERQPESPLEPIEVSAAPSPPPHAGAQAVAPQPHQQPQPNQQVEIRVLGDTYPQWVMAAMSVVAAGLSGWAVLAIYKTLDATRKLSAAENRAWLKIDTPEVKSKFVFNLAGAQSVINLSIKNIGKTPAQNVYMMIDTFFWNDDESIANREFDKTLLKCIEFSNYSQSVIFPDEAECKNQVLVFDRRKLAEAMKRPKKVGIPVIPFFAVFIAYRIVGDEKVHTTVAPYTVVGLNFTSEIVAPNVHLLKADMQKGIVT
ncbi:hypothetical protein [Thalassobaculum sp.]|uniref:hypothetical protein n=1 Tax=Thalassobaculum sp. TaxID=2022740 RepID=UPI0032EF3B2C